MAFEFVDLDENNITSQRTLQWLSDCIVIRNNTPYPFYLNWRTTSIPTAISYDEFIPAGKNMVIAAKGNNFGFFLDTQGAQTPSVGQKCSITIQADEVIPSFSDAAFQPRLIVPFTLNSPGNISIPINTVGAGGLIIGGTLNSGLFGGMLARLSFTEGSIQNIYRYWRFDAGLPLLRSVPGHGRVYNLLLQNEDNTAPATNTGTVSFTLMPDHLQIPVAFTPINITATSASLAHLGTITTTERFGIGRLQYIHFHFATANPTDTFDIAITTLANGGGGQIFRIRNGATFVNSFDMGSTQLHLEHRRLNQWSYRLDLNTPIYDSMRVRLENLSGANLSNVLVGWKGEFEF